jgi:hypothetical protein
MSMIASGESEELLAILDRNNYRPVLDMYIRKWAQNVGEKASMEYGEEFRYEHVGDLIRGLTE